MTQAQLMEELALTRKQIQTDMKALLVRGGSNRYGRWVVEK